MTQTSTKVSVAAEAPCAPQKGTRGNPRSRGFYRLLSQLVGSFDLGGDGSGDGMPPGSGLLGQIYLHNIMVQYLGAAIISGGGAARPTVVGFFPVVRRSTAKAKMNKSDWIAVVCYWDTSHMNDADLLRNRATRLFAMAERAHQQGLPDYADELSSLAREVVKHVAMVESRFRTQAA